MCDIIKEWGMYVSGLCIDRGSKAQKPFKTAFTNPPIIINFDLWHDLNKLEPFFKEEFKGRKKFDDKPVLLR